MTNPLLRYSLTPAPFPLQASGSASSPEIAALTLVATNPVVTTASLQCIEVQIPAGLCDAGKLGDVRPVAKTKGWRFDSKASDREVGRFAFVVSSPPFNVEIDGEIEFVFEKVEISTQPGTAEVTVTEWSGKKKPYEQASVELPLAKFPAGWRGDVQFWATNPNLPYPGEAELNWSGPAGATYSLEYSTRKMGVVNVPGPHGTALGHKGKYPPPPEGFTGSTGFPLEKTTIFTLNVQDTIDGEKFHAQKQITVTVAPKPVPPPKITQFKGKFVSRRGADQLLLSWKTENTQYCKLTGSTDELQPSSEDHKITPTANAPLLTTYTLEAVGANGPKGRPTPARKTLEVVWGVEAPGSPVGVATQPEALAVSPDGRRVYVRASVAGHESPLSAYDAQTLECLEQRPVDPQIGGAVGASPNGRTVFSYVTGNGDSGTGRLTAFSATTLELLHSSELVTFRLAVSPDGQRLYAADWKDVDPRHLERLRSSVLVLNAETLEQESRSPVWTGQGVAAVAASPDRKTVYVVTIDYSTWKYRVRALDAVTLKQLRHSRDTWKKAGYWIGLRAVPPDGKRIFVVDSGDDEVMILESESLEPVPHSPAKLGKRPSAVAVSRDGSRVFLTNRGDHTMTVLDGRSLEPAAHSPVDVGEYATAIAASPDGARVFVTNSGPPTLRSLVPCEELREVPTPETG